MSEHDAVVTHGQACRVCGGCDWVCADAVAELERRLAEALAALREHGGHDTECGVWDDDHECTCGLDAALRGEEASDG